MDSSFSEFREYIKKETNDSLKKLEDKERESGFPIIKNGVQDLIKVLMATIQPEYILELGTGVGFSSIFMASYAKSICEITTVELKEKNIERARQNITNFSFEDKIKIIKGDAVYITKNREGLRENYDFIFIDFAKGQYLNLWPHVKSLVKPGGIVITDNVLQGGTVHKSRFLLNRRDRTIHKRMRQFLYEQLNDGDFTGSVFEIDDGVSILTRNSEKT